MARSDLLEHKARRRPLIDPLLLALKSRRVVIAIAALLVGLLVMAWPELAAVQDELLVLVITLALGLIGGYSLEDAARVGRERAAEPDAQDIRDLVKLVFLELYDELTGLRDEWTED